MGSGARKANRLEARDCEIDSMGCYLHVDNLRLQRFAHAWFVIDEAQGLYVTLKLMQSLCKLCKYLQQKMQVRELWCMRSACCLLFEPPYQYHCFAMEFLKSAVASAISKDPPFPYKFGDRLTVDQSIWALHNGTKRVCVLQHKIDVYS